MAKKIIISELDFDTDGAVQAQANLLKEITKVKDAQKELRKETDNLSDANDTQRKSYVDNEQQLKKLNAEYKQNQKVITESTTAIDGLNDAMDKEIKTKRDAIKNNKELREIQKGVNATTEDGQALIAKLSKKIDENTDFIKENSDSFVKQKMNIGNYTDSVVSAANKVNLLGVGMGDLGTGLMGVGKGAGNGSKGLQIMRTAATALVAVPIIAVFAGLATMLTKTQEGMDIVNKLTMQLQGAFGVIIERASFLGKAVVKLFEGDFKGAVETAGKAFESGFVKQIEEAVEEGGAVAELQKANKQLMRDSNEAIAELEKQAEFLNAKAGDSTLTLQKQQKAAQAAAKVEVKLSNERIKQAKRQLKEAERIADLDKQRTSDELDQISELKVAVTEAEREKLLAIQNNSQLSGEIARDQFERDLDFLIDGFDVKKSILEREINLEETAAEDRISMLDELTFMFEQNIKEQQSLFQSQVDERIDLNELIAISDQDVLIKRIKGYKLDDIEAGRLLEAIKEYQVQRQDIDELTTDVVKVNAEEQLELNELRSELEIAIEEAGAQARIQELKDERASRWNIISAQIENETLLKTTAENQRYEDEKLRISTEYTNEEARKTALETLETTHQTNLNTITSTATLARSEMYKAQFQSYVDAAKNITNSLDTALTTLNDIAIGKHNKEVEAINSKYDLMIERAEGDVTEIERIEGLRDAELKKVGDKEIDRIDKHNKRIEALNKARAVMDVIQGTVKAGAQSGFGAVAYGLMGMGLLEAQGIPASLGLFGIPRLAIKAVEKLFPDLFGSDNGVDEGQITESGSGISGGVSISDGSTPDSGTSDSSTSDSSTSDSNEGSGGRRKGFAVGTSFVEGPGTATSDSILATLSRGEAVIPTVRNLQYLGLSKAMIDGNVGEWVLSNRHMINADFNDGNIVKGLSSVRNAVRSNKPIVNIEEVSLRDKMNRETYLQGKYGGIR